MTLTRAFMCAEGRQGVRQGQGPSGEEGQEGLKTARANRECSVCRTIYPTCAKKPPRRVVHILVVPSQKAEIERSGERSLARTLGHAPPLRTGSARILLRLGSRFLGIFALRRRWVRADALCRAGRGARAGHRARGRIVDGRLRKSSDSQTAGLQRLQKEKESTTYGQSGALEHVLAIRMDWKWWLSGEPDQRDSADQ